VSGREEQITSHKKLMQGDYSSPLISLSAPPEREREKENIKEKKTPAAQRRSPRSQLLVFSSFFSRESQRESKSECQRERRRSSKESTSKTIIQRLPQVGTSWVSLQSEKEKGDSLE
jgi:hypothetical protein